MKLKLEEYWKVVFHSYLKKFETPPNICIIDEASKAKYYILNEEFAIVSYLIDNVKSTVKLTAKNGKIVQEESIPEKLAKAVL